MKPLISLLLTAMLLALSGCDADRDPVTADSLALKPAQLDWVGQKIFANECASRFDCLVHWNEGEAFPSLGIGHFIWYPEGVEGRFTESFPQLIRYMVQRQSKGPDWLLSLEPFDAPWRDRAAFLALEDSSRVAELREFLAGTQGLQAEFIFRRAAESLGKIVEVAPENRQEQVSAHLDRKSTRLNSSHVKISYAVFCFKKKIDCA